MAFITKGDLPFLGYTAATLGMRLVPLSLRLRRYDADARRLGALWHRLDRSSASLARQNMQAILGNRLTDSQIESEIKNHFYVTALGKVVGDMLPELDLPQLNQILSLEGQEYLDAALADGRGVLLLGTHFGLHGYVPLTLIKRLEYAFSTVVGAEFSEGDSWVYQNLVHPIRSRNWHEMPIINPTGNPQREMMGVLQKKQVLMIWPDFVNEELFALPEPHALSVPFLGRMMPFRTGTFRLGQWMNVPMLPFFIVPREGGGLTMKITSPLPPNEEKGIDGLRADVAAYANRFEAYVYRYPGFWWQWRQKRLLELMQMETAVSQP